MADRWVPVLVVLAADALFGVLFLWLAIRCERAAERGEAALRENLKVLDAVQARRDVVPRHRGI